MSDESGSAPIAESGAAPEAAASNASPESQGSQASSVEGIEQALENGEISQKEAQKLIKKFELKVRGKTISKEIDLSDDNFIRDQLQLAEMSKTSMQESAELKKAYAKELERFKARPWEVLQELGFDPDELAQSRIEQRIEEMKKSPEQLEKEMLQKELQAAREEAKRIKEEKEAIEMQKLQEQAAIQINDEISKAISAHKTLPNSPYVTKRVADSMLWAINNGYEDVTAEDVIPLVEQEMRAELGQLYDEMPEELLENFIGKKTIDRMRKRRVAAVKVPSVNDIKPTTLANKAQESTNRQAQPKLAKDFFKNLGKK